MTWHTSARGSRRTPRPSPAITASRPSGWRSSASAPRRLSACPTPCVRCSRRSGPGLPPTLDVAIQSDASEVYRQRLQLLLTNGFVGLLLVLALLSVFLEFKLAFWVTVGIPTAFLGAFLFLPALGVSINMVSLFAFIIALGIVVDDAIVAGENIYEYRQRGMGAIEAADRRAPGTSRCPSSSACSPTSWPSCRWA
ncbi:MAG: efflux RND transporter permease subunit [Arhodomonas sp.]|nr:efflux RND transporter permease subunit [Arhodomonas sp.]